MKRGDLIAFQPFKTADGIHSPWITGIWLSARYTKWSETNQFHRILTPHGVQEYLLFPDEIQVISEAR